MTAKKENKLNLNVTITPTLLRHLEEIMVLSGNHNKSGIIQELIQERYLDLIQDQA